jgi:hypothetical protein
MTDPIVEEVRKHRDEHARKFNYDLNLICDDLRNRHAQNIERLAKIKTANQLIDPTWTTPDFKGNVNSQAGHE